MKAYSKWLASSCWRAWASAICVAMVLAVAGCAHIAAEPSPSESSRLEVPPDAFIYVGMSVEELEPLVGEPLVIDRPTEREGVEVWRYDFGVVIVEDGRVCYKWPPSRVVSDTEAPEFP